MIDKNPINRPKTSDLLLYSIDPRQNGSFSTILKNASDSIIKLNTEEEESNELNVIFFYENSLFNN